MEKDPDRKGERRENMRYLVDRKQMKEIDRYTIEEIGIPSMVLMERAALAVVEETVKLIEAKSTIWAACGNGNNGADGIAAARILYLKGYDVVVLLTGSRESGSREYLAQLDIAENLGMSVIEIEDFLPGRCDLLLDAIFGIGLSRAIEGEQKKAMEFLQRQRPKKVIAVDIPSGIHADTGAWIGPVIPADITVTFGYEKRGMAVYPGRTACGNIVIADIGFAPDVLKEVKPESFVLEEKDLSVVPIRPADSNKGSFGKVLIIAGSKNMSGAAYLSALAAYRSGAGLVRIVTDESNRNILQTQLAEAILTTYDPQQIEQEDVSEWVESLCEWASVIVIGPGLSREAYASRLLGLVLENAFVPIILDADALNAVAEHPHLASYFTENIIITPHLGEMARLTGKTIEILRENLYQAAAEYSDAHDVTCVLKDAASVAAFRDRSLYVNTSGCSAMAKGGSGDVLTGIIAGFLALGMEEKQAVSFGMYVHGLAGEYAARKHGNDSILASEIADEIGMVLRQR